MINAGEAGGKQKEGKSREGTGIYRGGSSRKIPQEQLISDTFRTSEKYQESLGEYCQGWGRGFESLRPLQYQIHKCSNIVDRLFSKVRLLDYFGTLNIAMRFDPKLMVSISVATKTRFLPLILASRQPVPLAILSPLFAFFPCIRISFAIFEPSFSCNP